MGRRGASVPAGKPTQPRRAERIKDSCGATPPHESWVEQAGGGAPGSLEFQAVGEAAAEERRGVDAAHRGKHGVAALPRCRLAVGHWPVRVGESDQAATACACAGQSGPLRRCDRVAHALSSARAHGECQPWTIGPFLAPRAALVGAVRAAPGKPGARHRFDSAVAALGRDGVVDDPGVECAAAPGRCWGRLPGAS